MSQRQFQAIEYVIRVVSEKPMHHGMNFVELAKSIEAKETAVGASFVRGKWINGQEAVTELDAIGMGPEVLRLDAEGNDVP